MNELRILTDRGEERIILHELRVELKKYKFTGAQSMMTSGDFGQMLFHHFKGINFDIWYRNYMITNAVKLIGRSDDPLLEFHTAYNNHFSSKLNDFTAGSSCNKQYQLTYAPYVDTVAEFNNKGRYDTFDIHFYKEILYPYAEVCPMLANFLNSVENKRSVQLLNLVRILTAEMEECIRGILTYSKREQLAARFYEGKVHELLIHLVDHIGLIDKLPELDKQLCRKAEEARKIILSDFSVYDTVEELARKVVTTEAKLQLAFKRMFGTTVAKFSRQERLKKAHAILSTENEILLSVALMVGYPDPGNFSTAFKNYFKYSPGHIQKRAKLQ